MARPDVICLTTGAFAQNGYIVADPGTREAIVVDPGEGAELFLRRLQSEKLTLRAIWLTHAHLDHVLGVGRVKDATGVPVYLHPADRPLYDRVAQQAAVFGLRADPPPPPDRELAGGDTLRVGTIDFGVRHVPGHSPGGVAFVAQGVAFVGDALFAGSIGRVDLPGGNGETLLTSIHQQLLTLPDETMIYSGHGPETTVAQERATNPFLTGAVRIV